MAVTMKNAVFWDVAPCRSYELNRCFRGMSVQFIRSTQRHIPEDGILQKVQKVGTQKEGICRRMRFDVLMAVILKNAALERDATWFSRSLLMF
jgi:hypothetical protein